MQPELPPYEPNRYYLPPAPVLTAFAERSGLGRGRRASTALRYGIPIALGLLVLVAVVSDVVDSSNAFWRSHQMIAGLASGMVLTLVAVFGVDRVLAARNRRKWLSVGILATDALSQRMGIEEYLYCSVYSHRGDAGIEGDYLEFLSEALADRETWEGGDEFPGLVECLVDEEEILREKLVTWASILIAESTLAEIADAAADVLTTMEHVNRTLGWGDPERELSVFEDAWKPGGELEEAVLGALRAHRYAQIRMDRLIASYRKEARLTLTWTF